MPRRNRQSGSFTRWLVCKHNRLTTRSRREAMRAATLALCFHAIISLSASGQSAATRLSDFQSWDELDVSARLAMNMDVSWISQGRFSTQFANPATYLSGAEATVGVGSHLLVAASFYYLAYKRTTGHSRHFQVPMLAATLKICAGTMDGFRPQPLPRRNRWRKQLLRAYHTHGTSRKRVLSQ